MLHGRPAMPLSGKTAWQMLSCYLRRRGPAVCTLAITSGKNKSAQATTPIRAIIGSGAGLFGRWLRRFDIHDTFLSAVLAPDGPVSCLAVRPHTILCRSAADGTDNTSILVDQFTRFWDLLQGTFLLFYSPVRLLTLVSRLKMTKRRSLPSFCIGQAWIGFLI